MSEYFPKPKILFVCGMNQWRSPTAEYIYKNDPRIEVRSAGVSSQAEHRISLKDIQWADTIFCMEKNHADRVQYLFKNEKLPTVITLSIGDEYRYMDPELISLLKDHVELFLQESGN